MIINFLLKKTKFLVLAIHVAVGNSSTDIQCVQDHLV